MQNDLVTWTHPSVAEVPLRRLVAHVGKIEVGIVEFDGTNQLWTWWSPLQEDAWGHAPTDVGAKQGFEVWLRGWLENFRPFFAAN